MNVEKLIEEPVSSYLNNDEENGKSYLIKDSPNNAKKETVSERLIENERYQEGIMSSKNELEV